MVRTSSARSTSGSTRTASDGPYHVVHESFTAPDAKTQYDPWAGEAGRFTGAHMPDDVTRDCARRMHYAAYRTSQARTTRDRDRWRAAYYACRDRIVMGNRKLIFRAVQRWMPTAKLVEDLSSDCHIVLIQAVGAYNPWLGIRFSTYAFTCLMRALSRLSQRYAGDRLGQSQSLESLPDGEPRDSSSEEEPDNGAGTFRLDDYFREGHELLSAREKEVLVQRFRLDDRPRAGTLEQVGRNLGLSKERVRQVQATALDKLRQVLGAARN